MRDDHEHGHIPPPDAPRKKRLLGLEPPHIVFGALFLIAILLIYLLLLARHVV
jgi:hypothetical protein